MMIIANAQLGPPVSNVHDSSSSSSSSAVAAAAALQAAMQVIKYMLTLQSFKYLVVCFLTFSKTCQSDWYYFIVFLRCCLLRSTRRIKMLRGGSLPCACLRFVQSHITLARLQVLFNSAALAEFSWACGQVFSLCFWVQGLSESYKWEHT